MGGRRERGKRGRRGAGENEERNGESEGWRYDGITEREREAEEGKERAGKRERDTGGGG
jgi:hypothetical protein